MNLEYERGDSNPHAVKALDPKSSASANSATLAYDIPVFNPSNRGAQKPRKLRLFRSVFNKLSANNIHCQGIKCTV